MTNSNSTWAFGDWWGHLNKDLAAFNQSPALYGDARYYYAANYSPFGAANMIAVDRDDAAALQAVSK